MLCDFLLHSIRIFLAEIMDGHWFDFSDYSGNQNMIKSDFKNYQKKKYILNSLRWIYLDLHTSVKATWTGNIVVLDEKESF